MEQDPVNPPPAPEIQRRISFYPAHLVGLILLALVPLLALFGVFGEVQANDSARSASFLLQVEYPAQSRHRIFETTTITVTNTSNQPYDAVTVKISEDYIGAFAEVAFDTEVEQITPDAYEFELTDMQPGDSQIIGIEFRADEYWQRDGWVTVSAPGAETVELRFGTFIFP